MTRRLRPSRRRGPWRGVLLVALLGAAWAVAPARAQQPDDTARAEIAALRENAERGNAASQYALGLRYANGMGGVERDPAEAVRWYRRSSEQGHVPAQFALAAMYERGIGVAADPVEAVRWNLAAALQGHAGAQHNLAASYETGLGVVLNEAQARFWYERAAAQGVAPSQLRVAEMYAEGRGGAVDAIAAEQWYRVAAAGGSAGARTGLGMLLADARGVEGDRRDGYARCTAGDTQRAASPVLEPGAHADITRPRLLRRVDPRLPDDAPGPPGGDVVLDVLLLADGRVGAVCVRRSRGAGFDGAAAAAVRQWEFAPATRSAQAVAAWIVIDVGAP